MKSHNDSKRNRVLFDFESIVDLKLSCIKEYLIDNGKPIINDSQLYDFKFNRMNIFEDPLRYVDKIPEDLSNPKYPVFTGMKTLIIRYRDDSNGLIDPVVLCKDEFQQRIIKESIPNVKILVGTRDKIKTLNFSRIVLGDPKHALEFRDPTTVEFMILNFRENFHEDDPSLIDERILIEVGDINTFSIAKAYPEVLEPVG